MNDVAVASVHDQRLPNEDGAYRAARDALLVAEAELRRQIERVAAQRRALPLGGALPQDYAFEEGEDARTVRLSQLFGDKQTLVLYSFMYGPAMERPCPLCSSMLDGLDGQAPHITQRVALAVAARSPIGRIRAAAAERGWRRLRLISSAGNSYHRDYLSESPTGDQWRCSTSSPARAARSAMPGRASSSSRPPNRAKIRATSTCSGRCGASST